MARLEDFSSALSVWLTAVDLRDAAKAVQVDEFYWHDARYNLDSSQGRELLFLIANHEWVRATSEIIDISRSDVIGTELKIDIDLSQITHEAFRGRTGRTWLPIALLPPQSGQPELELDLFATVQDASGNQLPLLPSDQLAQQISAALAEIVVNMAVAHMRSSENSRDERVLMSAAIYRLLQGGSPRTRLASVLTTRRVKAARTALLYLINPYIDFLEQRAWNVAPREQFVPELAHRAIIVLKALADSTIIAVPTEYDASPTVFTVRVPSRPLMSATEPFHPRNPATWLRRPSGRLAIDLLLPTADASRQIQVDLPDGVSLEQSATDTGSSYSPLARLDIAVKSPPPLQELSAAMLQIVGTGNYTRPGRAHSPVIPAPPQALSWPPSLVQSLGDLARAKTAIALETLRHYEVEDLRQSPSDSAGSSPSAVYSGLCELAEELDSFEKVDKETLAHLKETWDSASPGKSSLFRRVSISQPGPRTVLAHVEMIADVTQRATPERATVQLNVKLDDRDYLSIARTSTAMSLGLMIVVLLFLFSYALRGSNVSPAPEVLAIVLTLFATIQASRISRPDRSTLRGRLSAAGNRLIAASMLPPVILAVALAFEPRGWLAVMITAAFTVPQALLLVAMLRGPLTSSGSRRNSLSSKSRLGQPHMFKTAPLDYSRFEPLRSGYWQNTTADALFIGRLAHGYVVWQGAEKNPDILPQLTPLLRPRILSSSADESSSVLALLHSSTQRQAVTFVVFRDKPDEGWVSNPNIQINELDLDPDRLAPMDNVSDTVDVFIGVHGSEAPTISRHPLIAAIDAARNRLIVLEAEFPVPAPVPGYKDRQWARIRIALRDTRDLGRLVKFLETIYDNDHSPDLARHVVAVQMVPTNDPRITDHDVSDLAGHDEGAVSCASTGTFDAPNAVILQKEPADVPAWRMVALYAEARSNIESDLIRQVPYDRDRFQLAHLNFARLHGIAAVTLLLHEIESPVAGDAAVNDRSSEANDTGHRTDRDAQEGTDRAKQKWGLPRVVVNEEVSKEQLGPLIEYPLLRVRFRWRDRPGAMLDVLRSIGEALAKDRSLIDAREPILPYARLEIASGSVALGHLTIHLEITSRSMRHWNNFEVERLARKIGALASSRAVTASGSGAQTARHRDAVDAVIRIGLISENF